MKETLVTISKRTGFAISTVSRVLNGQAEKYRISRKTVELILAEARRCDYTPSLLAKGLRMKRTNTLGLLIPQVSNPYFADIASAIIREARSHGYTVMVVDTMENEENEQEGIRTMLSRRVDGIVAVPCGRTPDHLEKVDRSVPVMLVDRSFERTSLPYACTDNYRGGVEATRILLQSGHRRIACIQGVPHSMPNRRRVQGYLDALRQAGLQEEAIITGDAFSLENGYRQTKLAVDGPDRPTAIFALSNTILLGAVKAIRESGLRIPEDISVVSFDDNPYLDFLVPAITRIGQPVEEIGKQPSGCCWRASGRRYAAGRSCNCRLKRSSATRSQTRVPQSNVRSGHTPAAVTRQAPASKSGRTRTTRPPRRSCTLT